jgi:hypothetical protein
MVLQIGLLAIQTGPCKPLSESGKNIVVTGWPKTEIQTEEIKVRIIEKTFLSIIINLL